MTKQEAIEKIETMPHLGSDVGMVVRKVSVLEIIKQIEVPEWKDISSAPKDGRELIGLKVQDGHAPVRTTIWWDDVWCNDDGLMFFKPTHWMPLPESPKETA